MAKCSPLTRRRFVHLAASACAGCYFCAEAESASPRTVDAGPVAQFAADGVYDHFRNQGFFIVRRGKQLTALSSICTHRAVHLKAEPDHSFYCERHGSKFSPDGHVVHGPARRDLPILTTTVDVHAHLLVSVSAAG